MSAISNCPLYLTFILLRIVTYIQLDSVAFSARVVTSEVQTVSPQQDMVTFNLLTVGSFALPSSEQRPFPLQIAVAAYKLFIRSQMIRMFIEFAIQNFQNVHEVIMTSMLCRTARSVYPRIVYFSTIFAQHVSSKVVFLNFVPFFLVWNFPSFPQLWRSVFPSYLTLIPFPSFGTFLDFHNFRADISRSKGTLPVCRRVTSCALGQCSREFFFFQSSIFTTFA